MKVIVLGAGVVGVASAWSLAAAGHEVSVLDRQDEPGKETSYANGGQISAGHAEPWARPDVVPKVLKWLGREDAPLLFRPRADWAQWRWALGFARECLPGRFEESCASLAGLARFSRECLRALRAETGIHYDELSRGILHFCTDGAEFDSLARHAETMRSLGIERQVKSAAECLALEPALRASELPVAGGIYTPGDESGDARKFTLELARLCRTKGVSFEFNASVERIGFSGNEIQKIISKTKTYSADAYVVALGSYSPLLLEPIGIRIPVYPLKGYSVTVPLDSEQAAAAPTVSLTDEAVKVVISRLGDRLRAAGTAELTGYDTSVTPVRCDSILSRIQKLFPALKTANSVERWAGLRPATPTNVPVIGRTRYRNLFLNTGHGTLGWTLACGSARLLEAAVSGRKPEVDFPLSA